MPYTTCMPHTPHTHLGIPKSINPARRPGGFEIRRKKGSTYKQRGTCNPPNKSKAYSFAADCKSAEPK